MRSDDYRFTTFKPKLIKDLIRIGNKGQDGGYVISRRQVDITKVLLGLGINYDWTFEEEFKSLNESTDLFCYDFSISKSIFLKKIISSLINVISINSYTKEIFNKRSPIPILIEPFLVIKTYFKFGSFFKPLKRNFFFQKGISDSSSAIFITAPEMFRAIPSFNDLAENSVFVKMDIEESEYDILEDIIENSSKINGLTVEFHNLKHCWSNFNTLVQQLKKDFEIIHIHGNNSAGYISATEIPNLVEISFIKRNLLTDEEINSINQQTYPLEVLDKPNLPDLPDLKLSFK